MGFFKGSAVGLIGRNADYATSPDGSPYCRFSVGCSASREAQTTWVNCILFGKLAEILRDQITKGSKVYVDGKIEVKDYVGKDGSNKTSVTMFVNTIDIMERHNNGENWSSRADFSNAHAPAGPRQYVANPLAPMPQPQMPSGPMFNETQEDLPF